MSAATATVERRRYTIHGVGVDVVASAREVLEAMDLRFRDFRDASDGAASVRFDFETGSDGLGPPAPGRPVYETPYGTLHYSDADGVMSGTLADVHLRCESRCGLATISAPAFRERALYFATHPLATVALIELMERHQRFSLHAGCVAGPDGGGVLLSGPSGAGKSTLTLALARAGLDVLGDDTVFLQRAADGSDTIHVLGFSDTVGVGAFAAEHFPELRSRIAQPPANGFPKRLYRIEDLFGHPAIARCVPRAIVFSEVTPDRRSEIAPLDPGGALLRLVPDVLLTEAASTQAHLRAIAALLDQVSCYALRSGTDLERAAKLVRDLV